MRLKSILFVIGRILFVLSALFVLPIGCALIYGESPLPFICPALLSLGLGILLTMNPRKESRELFARDGFICVGFSWIFVSLIGAVPFILSGATNDFTNALFESVSGFTTTGSSVFADVEALPKGILLWRSLTQWLGGMGVLVFLLALMPKSEGKNSRYMHLMRAEVPGPSVDKIVPRLADTARVMYGLYIALTAVEVIFLLFGEMNLFEALTHSLSTASTGGFGIKNDSLGSYSAYSQYVVAIFMLIFGINFNVFYLLVIGQFAKAFKNEELKVYLAIVCFATAVIGGCIFAELYQNLSFEYSFRHALFQVASIISTAGFSTLGFSVWPNITLVILVLLMFSGACAGSTAGGIKLARLMLLAKNGRREIKYISQPRAVISVKMNGKAVDDNVVRGATSYIIMYGMLFVITTLLITAFDGVDLITSFTSVATAVNNVGPALGEATGSFDFYSAPSKLILCFNMLAGRLELFPILMLLSPSAYKKHA